jgi:diguanylate cyclase
MTQRSQDWRTKYHSSLKQQESQERQFRQLITLLTKGLTRMSLVAEGVDSQLDKQLSGMRQLLRADSPSGRDINMMVEALEGQVKRMDLVKAERAKVLNKAFQSLTKQLKKLKPEPEARGQLKTFNKRLKNRTANMQEYSALINEYAGLQGVVLQKTPPASGQAPSLWNKLFSRNSLEVSSAEVSDELVTEISPDKNVEEESSQQASLKMADDVEIPLNPIAAVPDKTEKEPPFSRLNHAVCSILNELLQQIDPPPSAGEDYKAAKKQLEQGLNWFELVPTLENVSIVIISAIDRDQKEFEQFLQQLNQRLVEAYEYIDASQQFHGDGLEAGRKLSTSVREQVTAIKQSVDSATELDYLKTEVSNRIDQIVAAMDHHQSSEEVRDQSLSEQLDTLVERVKNMEQESVNAEEKIEEQRQLALRDVLTQLPNRAGYEQRLAQEFERWQRYGRPLTLVVCDIDHFKKVNDTYGHLAGDKVLRIIAKTLAKRLRKTDYIARFGGEEFVILLPETSEQNGFDVVNTVREAIASCPFHFKEKPVSITLSFGVTEFREGDQPEAVFGRADKALYQAKDEGRNCCILASDC